MAQTFQCTRCDFKANRINGLSRHLSQTHGVAKDDKPKAPKPSQARAAAAPRPKHRKLKRRRPTHGTARPADETAGDPAPVVPVNAARTLLLEKLEEQISDVRAELRVLERLRERT